MQTVCFSPSFFFSLYERWRIRRFLKQDSRALQIPARPVSVALHFLWSLKSFPVPAVGWVSAGSLHSSLGYQVRTHHQDSWKKKNCWVFLFFFLDKSCQTWPIFIFFFYHLRLRAELVFLLSLHVILSHLRHAKTAKLQKLQRPPPPHHQLLWLFRCTL